MEMRHDTRRRCNRGTPSIHHASAHATAHTTPHTHAPTHHATLKTYTVRITHAPMLPSREYILLHGDGLDDLLFNVRCFYYPSYLVQTTFQYLVWVPNHGSIATVTSARLPHPTICRAACIVASARSDTVALALAFIMASPPAVADACASTPGSVRAEVAVRVPTASALTLGAAQVSDFRIGLCSPALPQSISECQAGVLDSAFDKIQSALDACHVLRVCDVDVGHHADLDMRFATNAPNITMLGSYCGDILVWRPIVYSSVYVHAEVLTAAGIECEAAVRP